MNFSVCAMPMVQCASTISLVRALIIDGLAMKDYWAVSALDDQHGEDRLEVALASGNDAFIVQQRQGQTARGAGQLDQTEAAQRQGRQLFFFGYPLECPVDFHCLQHVVGSRFAAGKGLPGQLGGGVAHLFVRDGIVVLITRSSGTSMYSTPQRRLASR